MYNGPHTTVIVPAGFETDFASVPRWAWWFCCPATGNHVEPSVMHDWLCATGDGPERADNLFKESMAANGVSWIKRTVLYTAVKIHRVFKK